MIDLKILGESFRKEFGKPLDPRRLAKLADKKLKEREEAWYDNLLRERGTQALMDIRDIASGAQKPRNKDPRHHKKDAGS